MVITPLHALLKTTIQLTYQPHACKQLRRGYLLLDYVIVDTNMLFVLFTNICDRFHMKLLKGTLVDMALYIYRHAVHLTGNYCRRHQLYNVRTRVVHRQQFRVENAQ